MLQCHTAAQQLLRLYLSPDDAYFDIAQVFVSWAQRKHWHWFYGYRPAVESVHWFPPEDAYAHSDDNE